MARRILIVGGQPRNIPPVFSDRFDIEHVHQDESNGYIENYTVDAPPDLVVVLISWCSHHACKKAREIANAHNAPCVESPGGFSKLRHRLLEQGITWVEEELAASCTVKREIPEVNDPWVKWGSEQQELAVKLTQEVEDLKVELECAREEAAVATAPPDTTMIDKLRLDLRATLVGQQAFLSERREKVEARLVGLMEEHSALSRQLLQIETQLQQTE